MVLRKDGRGKGRLSTLDLTFSDGGVVDEGKSKLIFGVWKGGKVMFGDENGVMRFLQG